MFKQFVTAILVIALGCPSFLCPHRALAGEISPFSLSENALIGSPSSEYTSGKSQGAVLMRVNLWGGVRKPGIHHIPVGTHLITLLSYAGGPDNDAKLDKVTIKRNNADGTQETIKFDVEEILEGHAKSPVLAVNDIVVVPQTKPFFSANTLTTLTVLTMLGTIVMTGFLISQQAGK